MTLTMTRRTFLNRYAAGAVVASGVLPAPAGAASAGSALKLANDDTYWAGVATQYSVSQDVVNLENGYYGIMSRPVTDAYKRNIDYLNRENSRFLRRQFDEEGIEVIRRQLAAHLGAPVDEVAITRGATESLQNLISNYRNVGAGDTVIYGDLDYDAMQYVMQDLAQRRGASAVMVRVPEPATTQAVLDVYEAAMRNNPRARLLLVTHISHRTGLVFPVQELVAMAKRRGIDVIVDVAQSWGQPDYKLPDLQADFIGGNLHKWIGAPLGLGFIYIRKDRLADIGVHLGDRENAATDIRARVHSGTLNAATIMTIPDALQFHASIGTANKGARLRHLRDHWVQQVRDNPRVQLLTPDTPGLAGAVTSFRLAGKATPEDNKAVVSRLFDQFGIFTVARHGLLGGSCVRVTPALYTRPADLDRLAAAINAIAAT